LRLAVFTGGVVGLGAFVAAQASALSDPESPAELREGPSLRETGRMAPLSPHAAEIAPPAEAAAPSGEKSIRTAAAIQPAPVGTIDPAILAEEIGARLSSLDECVIEVARRQRVPPSKVLADSLTLRFRIERSGRVAAPEVVATSATDPDVLECVKGKMKSWTFTRPKGGTLPIERAFHFPPPR